MTKFDLISAHINRLIVMLFLQVTILLFTLLSILLIPIFIIQIVFTEPFQDSKDESVKEDL